MRELSYENESLNLNIQTTKIKLKFATRLKLQCTENTISTRTSKVQREIYKYANVYFSPSELKIANFREVDSRFQ